LPCLEEIIDDQHDEGIFIDDHGVASSSVNWGVEFETKLREQIQGSLQILDRKVDEHFSGHDFNVAESA
jgi:hypothetical protein